MLRCSKCKKELTLEHFHKDGSNSRGYQYQCKTCKQSPTAIKLHSRKPKICTAANCLRPTAALGLCQTHRKQIKNGKPLTDIVWNKRTGISCEFEGCQRKVAFRRYCYSHWKMLRQGKALRPLRILSSGRLSPWEYHLRRKYSMSWKDFAWKLLLQEFKCPICEQTPSGNWHVDHDHACCSDDIKTCGRCVRGLLCASCNIGLGMFLDNPAALDRAARYVRTWQTDEGDF